MIIHYNCTIGNFLLHFFLLIYHPYPPSFHEMIFILVIYMYLLKDWILAKLRQLLILLLQNSRYIGLLFLYMKYYDSKPLFVYGVVTHKTRFTKFNISEVLKAGSLGHGTVVPDHYDIDLVIYSRGTAM